MRVRSIQPAGYVRISYRNAHNLSTYFKEISYTECSVSVSNIEVNALQFGSKHSSYIRRVSLMKLREQTSTAKCVTVGTTLRWAMLWGHRLHGPWTSVGFGGRCSQDLFVRVDPLPSAEGTTGSVARTFTWKPGPDSGLGSRIYAESARQRQAGRACLL